MIFTIRPFRDENDYWTIRNFLREVFLQNERIERDTHVALLDHWRWHYIATCGETGPVEEVTTLWETGDCEIAAVLHPICHDEICLHILPRFRKLELLEALIAYAEDHHSDWYRDGQRILYVPVFEDDTLLQELLTRQGFVQRAARDFHWRRDLETPLPVSVVPAGYVIRSMGAEDELPARSWASWRAFHAEEPDENYDGDHSWYRNMQSAPLYRRDLDLVAATPSGEIAAFCTISYDDYTRSAVIVLEGTAAEHIGCGLEEALMVEGMRRLKKLGCTRLFAIASDEVTQALYRSIMQDCLTAHPWTKVWHPKDVK